MNAKSAGFPAPAPTAPSCTATACTRCIASTTSPRRTDTLIGSMAPSLKIGWPAGGLWRHGDFLRLWGAQTGSQFGTQVTLLALPLTAILVLDASTFEVAALGAVDFLPFLLFA